MDGMHTERVGLRKSEAMRHSESNLLAKASESSPKKLDVNPIQKKLSEALQNTVENNGVMSWICSNQQKIILKNETSDNELFMGVILQAAYHNQRKIEVIDER